MAETTQTGVAMHNLYLLADHNVSKHREERENGGHSRLPVYDEKRDMVDFEPIGKIPNSSPSFIGMCDDDDFVTTIDQFLEYMSAVHRMRDSKRVFIRLIVGRCDFQHHLEEVNN